MIVRAWQVYNFHFKGQVSRNLFPLHFFAKQTHLGILLACYNAFSNMALISQRYYY